MNALLVGFMVVGLLLTILLLVVGLVFAVERALGYVISRGGYIVRFIQFVAWRRGHGRDPRDLLIQQLRERLEHMNAEVLLSVENLEHSQPDHICIRMLRRSVAESPAEKL